MKSIQLTNCEAKLITELLERERSELGPEIHHTDSSSLRHELDSRSHTVGRLLERLSESEFACGCGCKKH